MRNRTTKNSCKIMEFLVLPWQVGQPFSVIDTGDHVIAHVVSMRLKIFFHINNELRLRQDVSHMCSIVLKMM